MKKVTMVSLLALGAFASAALAGSDYSGKEMKQTAVQPNECWYGDNEWDVSLWGAYAFTGRSDDYVTLDEFGGFLPSSVQSEGRYDKYLGDDHAWGGGLDAKYFWHKYFGFGVEGFALDAKRREYGAFVTNFGNTTFDIDDRSDHHTVGGALGTFTLRYPIGCSRFAPYGWAGVGGIWGGGEKDQFTVDHVAGTITTGHTDSEGKVMGQFGGGFEVRITRHIGWINDFSWNVLEGPHNNFGMARSGLNFAF